MKAFTTLAILALMAWPSVASDPSRALRAKKSPTHISIQQLGGQQQVGIIGPVQPQQIPVAPEPTLEATILEAVRAVDQSQFTRIALGLLAPTVCAADREKNWFACIAVIRINRLLNESEDLRQARLEMRRFWMNNQPSVRTYERLNGPIGP